MRCILFPPKTASPAVSVACKSYSNLNKTNIMYLNTSNRTKCNTQIWMQGNNTN